MKPDPTLIYALSPAQIRINDVVLTSGSGLFSSVIRWVTRSNFSHAAIVTRPGSLIEAVRGGVVRRSLLGVWATRPEWICVLRPPSGIALLSPAHLTLAEVAEQGFANPYSLVGAVGSKLKWLRPVRRGGLFCSELVAAAFAQCGFTAASGSAHTVSPAQLKSAGRLTDVTASCVRILERPQDDWQLAIDMSKTDHSEAEARVLRRTYRALKAGLSLKLPIEELQSTPAIIGWLMSQDRRGPGIVAADTTTASILEYGGYVRFFTDLSIRDVLGAAATQGALLTVPALLHGSRHLWVKELQRATVTLNERASSAEHFAGLFAKNRMCTARVLRDMYRSMERDALKRAQVLQQLIAAST